MILRAIEKAIENSFFSRSVNIQLRIANQKIWEPCEDNPTCTFLIIKERKKLWQESVMQRMPMASK